MSEADSRLSHPSNRYPHVLVVCDDCERPLGLVPLEQAFDRILCAVCKDLRGGDGDVPDWKLLIWPALFVAAAMIVLAVWFNA